MADPGRGHKAFVQVGTQSVYETGVNATQKLEMLSEAIELVPSEIVDESLYDGRSPRAIIDGGILARGPLRRRANYDGELQLLRAMMGNYSSAVVEGSVRDHTFKEGDQRILTLEIPAGGIPSSAKVEDVVGAKVRSLMFEARINQMATWEYDLLARDRVPDQDITGSLNFPAVLPVQFNHVPGAGLVDGTNDQHTTDVRVRGIKINYGWPLEEDSFQLGPSANLAEPFPTDMISCEWEIEQEFRTKTLFETLRARTEATLDVKFQHPTTIGTSSKREIQFTSWTAKLMGYTRPIDKWGKLISTARWQARFDPISASCLVVRVRNTEAALT